MSPDNRYVLISAGGAGTRLWPMSRQALPKQFQHLLGAETPFQHMVRLIQQVVPLERIFVMAVAEFRDLILEQVPGLNPENVLLEPSRRDNGPAVAYGMAQIHARNTEAVVASLWSDHLVLDEKAFAEALEAAFQATTDHGDAFIAVGIKPTKADPTLGYIELGEEVGTRQDLPLYQVRQFTEKPDQATAESFVESGRYLWNSGYFVMTSAAFLQHLISIHPELEQPIARLQSSDTAAYEELPKLSLDYLFTQQLEHIFVIPADIGWSDLGTWTTLYKMLVTKSGEHLVTQGPVHSINTENSLVFAKDRPITLVGVKDLIVVDTGDTLLVMHHDAPPGDLKNLLQDTLSETNPELL